MGQKYIKFVNFLRAKEILQFKNQKAYINDNYSAASEKTVSLRALFFKVFQ